MALSALAATDITIAGNSQSKIRLGGPIFENAADPEAWAKAHRALGYSAAYCPLNYHDSAEQKRAFAEAARQNDLLIAEVGAWSNPISSNKEESQAAIMKNIEALALAEEVGALCAVNIAGSRGEDWAGIHPLNTSDETFEMVVAAVRHIIDSVKPTRAFYTLETMPYTIPDSPDVYLSLIKAIDRRQFACHLDPVNLINSPRRFYNNGELIRECFKKLGPYIKSCHAKDVALQNKALVHLDEVIPGQGGLNYAVLLSELSKLPGAAVLMLEHLQTAEEYQQAANYIRQVASREGVQLYS